MVTTLVASLLVGGSFSTSPTPAAGRYDLLTKTLICDNKASLIGNDDVYGISVFYGTDPADAGVKGYAKFSAQGMKKGTSKALNLPIVRRFSFVKDPGLYFVHTMLCEQDRENPTAIQNAFLAACKENIVSLVQDDLNFLRILREIESQTRKKMRASGRWLRNDEDVIGYSVINFPSDKVALAETEGAEVRADFYRPGGRGKYKMVHRLQKSN